MWMRWGNYFVVHVRHINTVMEWCFLVLWLWQVLLFYFGTALWSLYTEAGLEGSSWKVSVRSVSLACVNICLWCENGNLGSRIDAVLAQFPACNPVQTDQSSRLRGCIWGRERLEEVKRDESQVGGGGILSAAASTGRGAQLHCCYFRL